MSRFDKALRDVAIGTEVVVAIREDALITRLLENFKTVSFSQIDARSLNKEIVDMATQVSFDSSGFNLSSRADLSKSVNHAIRINAVRSRMVEIQRILLTTKSKTKRIKTVCGPLIRQHPACAKLRGAEMTEIISCVLYEITDLEEDIDLMLHSVKEALSDLDRKTETLDYYANQHKQYVFLSGRGGRIGKKTKDEDDEDASR